MKRKYFLIPLALFAVVLCSVLVYENFTRKKQPYMPLLDRTGPISTASEWKNTKAAIEGLQTKIRQKPGDLKAKLMLALAYMQEARVTGEHPYYYPAALDLIDEILDKNPEDASLKYEAIVAKASVLLSLHHFEEAREIGQEALTISNTNASIYGILCDANVELGNYKEGIKMADKMVSIRPDIRSYARISYLREIYGDMDGAIEAMVLAAKAGYPGLEQTAWTRITLGQLYEKKGDLLHAASEYQTALLEYPNYAFAIAGLGRLEAKKKNYTESIKLFNKAATIIPEFSFQEDLVELYESTGQKAKAASTTKTLLAMLEEDAAAGHYVDLEMANIYTDIVKDYNKALEYANNEYEKRPENIDVCKAMAHIYYKKNDIEAAKKFLQQATRTNKQDPSLLCLSGLIRIHSGDKKKGIELINKSFQMNPFQNDPLSEEAIKYVSSSHPKVAVKS